jgi:hypothetical protein
MPSNASAQSVDDKKFLAMAAQSDQDESAMSKIGGTEGDESGC